MTTILMLHIVSAMLLTGASLAMVVGGVVRREINNIRLAAFGGLAATALSGAGLLAFGANLGHFCASMTALTLTMVAAYYFYARRIAAGIR